MKINPNLFIHKDDQLALNTLKSIPGFTPLLKAFLKVWSEEYFKIENMSSNLKLGPNQLPKYYNMLLPICEKLGIDVPELYLKLDVQPNAWTSGDTKPFIVITSGLIETIPEHLIPTVLAHECGHIACHHVLYHTMGQIICSEAINFLPYSDLISLPIQKAFAYWMRCSEFSADRVAMICDGSSDNIIELMSRFAGFDKDIQAEINIEEFLNQAIDYRNIIQNNQWSKTLEFIFFSDNSHPLVAVRGLEAREWSSLPLFRKLTKYITSNENNITDFVDELPIGYSSKDIIGKNYKDSVELITNSGFKNIELIKVIDKKALQKEGQVLKISIGDKDSFSSCDWFNINSQVNITYYESETEEELLAKHPNELRIPYSSKQIQGRIYKDIYRELVEIGFTNVIVEEIHRGKKGIFDKDNSIFMITINGYSTFSKNDWFPKDSCIKIQFNTYTS